MELGSKLNLDIDASDTYSNKSKKPEIRVLDNHTFTVMLDIKHKDPKMLETEAIYFFLGTWWLITIHSEIVHIKEIVERLFEIKNKKIKEHQLTHSIIIFWPT
jgi:magnesium transporter